MALFSPDAMSINVEENVFMQQFTLATTYTTF